VDGVSSLVGRSVTKSVTKKTRSESHGLGNSDALIEDVRARSTDQTKEVTEKVMWDDSWASKWSCLSSLKNGVAKEVPATLAKAIFSTMSSSSVLHASPSER